MNRPAFTLVELMIATFITCLIAAGVFMFFSGSGRLSKDAYEAVSAAMDSRAARENSIFGPGRSGGEPYLPYDTGRRWEGSR